MKQRKLKISTYEIEQDEDSVPELESAVHLAVITKAPEKYILIDTETGKAYRGSNIDNTYLPGYKIWKQLPE
jgi:hypothetical protein